MPNFSFRPLSPGVPKIKPKVPIGKRQTGLSRNLRILDNRYELQVSGVTKETVLATAGRILGAGRYQVGRTKGGSIAVRTTLPVSLSASYSDEYRRDSERQQLS